MGNSQSPLNFGAGPAKMPRDVLKEVKEELLCYKDTGMSIMEISHRSKEFMKINSDAQTAIRDLLNVPDNYKILFIQGGGRAAFDAVAMNLMNRSGSADFAVTGIWSAIAAREATKYGKVNLVFPKADKQYSIPDQKTWNLDSNASYLYYCDNETIEGVEFPFVPEPRPGVPLVSDMSSSILSKQIDISKFGVIFGGTQKNIGPAGVAIIIIREDLLGNPMKMCPSVLDFTHIAKENSIQNTPNTFSVYVMEKVLQWIKKNGGISEMERLSKVKSQLLYKTIKDSENFYCCLVDEKNRSRLNVSFRIGSPDGSKELEAKFVEEAEKHKMYQLRGHSLVGGIRASLYNAVSLDDVQCLVKFMIEFQKMNVK